MAKVEIKDNHKQVIDAKDKAIEAALYAVGMFLAGQASGQLEANPRRVDTGRLRNSLAFATSEKSGRARAPIVGISKGDDATPHGMPEKGTMAWGTNVEYAEYVHEGTSKMAPNRFIKNSWEINKDQVKKYIEDALKG